MDNQATKAIKIYLTPQQVTFQLVKPHNHRANAIERARSNPGNVNDKTSRMRQLHLVIIMQKIHIVVVIVIIIIIVVVFGIVVVRRCRRSSGHRSNCPALSVGHLANKVWAMLVCVIL